MGKRGPAPKPAHLRLLDGARPAEVNKNEPVARADKMEPPPTLSDDQRAIFEWVVAELEFMGIAATPDRDALAAYCVAVDTHRKASAVLARSGLMVKRKSTGDLVRNPLLIVQRDAAQQIRQFAQEFGLTPSARARINTERLENDADNPFADAQ